MSLLATALPALAHHTTVSGQAVCQPDGTYLVTWKVQNGQWGNSGNATLTAVSRTIDGIAEGDVIPPNGSITGTEVLPGTTTGTQWLEVSAEWDNEQTKTNRGKVKLDGKCEPDPVTPVPSGSLTPACGAWSAAVSVAATPPGRPADPAEVTFEVRENGVAIASVTLPPGGSDTLSGTFPEDSGDHELALVAIGYNGSLDKDTVETDCQPSPEVTVGDRCAPGGIEILLSNPDEPEALFSIYHGAVLVGTETLSQTAAPVPFIVPAEEGETIDLRVVIDEQQEPIFERTVTRDCDDPVVVVDTCTPDGALVVTVSEVPGDWFEITVEGDNLSEPIVRDGRTDNGDLVEVFDVPDGTYTVTVMHDGPWSWTDTITVDCEPMPGAVAITSCTEGGVLVTLANEDAVAATFEVLKGGQVVDTVTVTGGVDTVVVPFDEDETATVAVTSAGETLISETFTLDCEEETEVGGEETERPTTSPSPSPSPSPTETEGETDVAEETVSNPAPAQRPLPRTGAPLVMLGLLGLLSLAFGIATERRTRRR